MKTIQEALKAHSITHSDQSINKFKNYFNNLNKWNKIHNLTRIPEGDKSLIKHLVDSLSLIPYTQGHHSIMDVGSGAGLPGVLLAIAQPEIKFTLVESSSKRCAFLKHIRHTLKLHNVSIINQRIEQLSSQHSTNLVLTRAFAPLATQWKYIGHMLDGNTSILAMKGKIKPEELISVIKYIHAVIKLPPSLELHHRHLIHLKHPN